MKKRMMSKKGGMALSQIIILIVGIVSFSSFTSSLFCLDKNSGTFIEKSVCPGGTNPYTTRDGVIEAQKKWYGIEDNPKTDKSKESSSMIPTVVKDIFSYGDAEGLVQKEGIFSNGKYFVDGIASSAAWALTVYMGVKMVAGFFGLNDNQANAAATALGAGVFVGKSLTDLTSTVDGSWYNWFNNEATWLSGDKGLSLTPGEFGFIGGAITAVIIFYSMYKNERVEVVTYTCEPWDAPTGGERCEDCNKQGILPCSEYQCRSLGQACELLNPGTEEEKCEWVNRHDVNPPVIRPENNALLDNYRYTPDNTISPPDSGVMIDNQDSTEGCVKAFTPLTFGISTDEPSKCKLDYLRKDNFDEMDFYFGGSNLFRYNHTQMLSLPGPSSLRAENLTLENDGDFTLYTRCSDANGNYNTANFVFKYCVEQGPDTTPPLIVDTNQLNNMPISFNTSELDLIVYTNEPASCKWSHLDQSYDDMEETMSCSSSITEMNAQLLYECDTTLTGIRSNQENNFYFRCKDQPLAPEGDRMVNQESYEYVVIGTLPLVLDSVGPNGTIKDSTETVKVTLEAETSAGYNEGEATCYFSDVDETDSYIPFFNTDSYVHSQDLWLPEGDYEYFIKCIDLGGNQDSNVTIFKTESDADAPIIVRAYHEESYLKLITNEKAECVYSQESCSYLFDDGIKITVIDDVEHFTDWSTSKNFYVKCRDEYGREPLPNECSMTVRPYQVFSSGEDD